MDTVARLQRDIEHNYESGIPVCPRTPGGQALPGHPRQVACLMPYCGRMDGDNATAALADYGCQFERTIRTAGEDPSIFAIALETLAVKAFGDMGQTARLRIIRDRFIAGHDSCELRRHLDSVSPETPIQDIVDRCQVWESHADSRRLSKPEPDMELPIYAVNESGCGMDNRMVAAVTTSQTTPDQLETLLRHLGYRE